MSGRRADRRERSIEVASGKVERSAVEASPPSRWTPHLYRPERWPEDSRAGARARRWWAGSAPCEEGARERPRKSPTSPLRRRRPIHRHRAPPASRPRARRPAAPPVTRLCHRRESRRGRSTPSRTAPARDPTAERESPRWAQRRRPPRVRPPRPPSTKPTGCSTAPSTRRWRCGPATPVKAAPASVASSRHSVASTPLNPPAVYRAGGVYADKFDP